MRVLQRRDHDERLARPLEVARQGADDAGERATAVRATVHGEVLPRVGVALGREGRKVGRVGEDPVEPPEPAREVRADQAEGKPFVRGDAAQTSERERVPVGRDDPGTPTRGDQRREPAARADLEQADARPDLGEREE